MEKIYTEEEVRRIVKGQNIRFLRSCFIGINGILENIEVPLNQLDKILASEICFDGSSVGGYVRVEESDMVLYPDFSAWTVLPWGDNEDDKIGRLICSVHNTDSTPLASDPRSNLKRVVAEMKDMGYSNFKIGFEAELFLFKEDNEGNWTTKPTDQSSYFDMASGDKDAKCRRDIVETSEKISFEVEAAHHEVGAGQQEVDFRFDDAVATADRVLTSKMVVKQIAKKHDSHTAFMSRPFESLSGSGMHTNMSLFKDGKNVPYDKDGGYELPKTTPYFLNGILGHTGAPTCAGNPTVNSYKRLIPEFETPICISWADKNRSPLVRVPGAEEIGTRPETRSADPTANPYLLLAACLKTSPEGIKETKIPMAPVTSNVFEVSAEEKKGRGIITLPSTLHDVTRYFKQDKLIQDALGKHLTQSFTESKEPGWAQYTQSVSDWKRSRYVNY